MVRGRGVSVCCAACLGSKDGTVGLIYQESCSKHKDAPTSCPKQPQLQVVCCCIRCQLLWQMHNHCFAICCSGALITQCRSDWHLTHSGVVCRGNVTVVGPCLRICHGGCHAVHKQAAPSPAKVDHLPLVVHPCLIHFPAWPLIK